ncbi:immune inhibitor A [Hazenella sp. IB182353]|uniref:immune inhibitor A domain-containing protein n=1 Tax=Polycladospora coralii TaxID=2771432 RepID=UPI001BCA7462|nr:immune inhibitor A domain-containing protein [Polycladospora coralii]MBS7530974.1 immune inhibitor A [Polycladospora coralii]
MNLNKPVIALLSTSLVVGAMLSVPTASFAKNSSQPPLHKEVEKKDHIDWAIVNEEKLAKSLVDKGVLKENATPAEIEKAVTEFVRKGENPNSATEGIDTSSKFGKKIYKNKKKLQEDVANTISGLKGKFKNKKKTEKYTDHAVVALIEYSDFKHNSIERESANDFWLSDFNPQHYENLLFSKKPFKYEGKNLITFKKYYLEQSSGFWDVDGEVTPWIQAKHTAEYYGAHYKTDTFELNDVRPRELVKETLETVGKQIAGNEAKFDQRDPYDIDGDGNVMEADGLLDNLFIVHAGMGEEAGGGAQGENAIWSHRSVIDNQPVEIPGTSLMAYDYIIQPEDGAVGVFAHEYGHNLGLPDEYDIAYSGEGSPVGYWSLMSGGSWSGKTLGTEPTGFSPWAKLFFNETFGGEWPNPKTIDYNALVENKGYRYTLKEAVAKTDEGKLIKIDLPDKLVDPITQPLGTKSYFSTKGDELNTKMTSTEIDLTGKSAAKLSFESFRDIEPGYDYLYVNVYADGATEPTQLIAYDDTTDGWVKEELDLTAFAGKKIKIEFNYVTDIAWVQEGFYVDNIAVEADGEAVFTDNAEGKAKFTLAGFEYFDGAKIAFPHYYMVEYRSHNGVDKGLKHIRRSNSLLEYDPGVVVWYYDGSYGTDNMTGNHPGEGFLGVVDAHQRGHYWNNGNIADTRYQISDAAFGLKKTSKIDVQYPDFGMRYEPLNPIRVFNDSNDYTSPYLPEAGKKLPNYGLQIKVKKIKDGKFLRKDGYAKIEVIKTK